MVRSKLPNTPHPADGVTLTWIVVLSGVKRLAPLSLFVIPFGIGFRVTAIEQGLTGPQALVMSAAVFSGAAQFASLDFWPHPVNLFSLALVIFAINGRHVITGAALSPWLNQLPLLKRWLALGLLSDPNFTDSQHAFQAGEKDVGILLGGGLILWLNWILGTAIGTYAGTIAGSLQSFGFDVVMVCFFVTVMTQKLRQRSSIVPAVIAASVSVLTLGWLPTGWNIIAAALVGGAVGVVREF